MMPSSIMEDFTLKKKQFFHSTPLRVTAATHTYPPLPFAFSNPYRVLPPMKGLSITTSTTCHLGCTATT